MERFEAHIAPVLIPLPHDALYRSRGDGEEEAEPGINYPFPTADNSGSNNGNGKSDSSSSSSSKPARRRSMLTPPPVPFAPPSPPPAAATTSDDQLHPPSSCSSAPRVFFPPLPPPAQPALASPRSSHQPANGTLSVAVADPEGGIKLTQEAPRAGVKLEGVRVDEHGTSLHVDAGSEQEGEQGLDPHEVPAETQSNTANSAAEVPSLAHEARTTSSALPPPTPASDAGPSVREVASGEAAKGEGEMLLVGGSPPLPLEAPNSASVEEEEEVWNEESARSWLRSVLIGASSQGSHSFESPHLLDDLRDGTALCDLLNVLLEVCHASWVHTICDGAGCPFLLHSFQCAQKRLRSWNTWLCVYLRLLFLGESRTGRYQCRGLLSGHVEDSASLEAGNQTGKASLLTESRALKLNLSALVFVRLNNVWEFCMRRWKTYLRSFAPVGH